MATFAEAVAIAKSQVPLDIAAFARKKNAEILNTDPHPLGFKRWVDGQEGAQEETVKVGGTIVYEYSRYDLVAEWILTTLREKSPVKSGDYVSSHALFLNGVEVDTLGSYQPGDVITISNYVPYARKIEVGITHGHKINLSVAPHVYETTAQLARTKYKDLSVKIEFLYTSQSGRTFSKPKAPKVGTAPRKRKGPTELVFPTIRISAENG